MNWQQLIPKGFMVVIQMLFMDDHSCWMVILLLNALTNICVLFLSYLLDVNAFIRCNLNYLHTVFIGY